MSHKIPIPGSQFEVNYPMPSDPVGIEVDLIEESRRWPSGGAIAVTYNLSVIQRATGADVPTRRILDQISGPADAAEHMPIADDLNYLRSTWGPNSFSMLFMPPDNEPKIEGPMPDEAAFMIDGLYRLVGARTLRSDHAQKEIGIVVREGAYHGTPVHFLETFNIPGYGPQHQPIFNLAVIGRNSLTEALLRR